MVDGELEQTAWAVQMMPCSSSTATLMVSSPISPKSPSPVIWKELKRIWKGCALVDTDEDVSWTRMTRCLGNLLSGRTPDGSGTVGEGELILLADAGVEALNLVSNGQGYTAENGEVIVHGETQLEFEDGTTTVAADTEFSYENVQSPEEQQNAAADDDSTQMVIEDLLEPDESIEAVSPEGETMEISAEPVEPAPPPVPTTAEPPPSVDSGGSDEAAAAATL